MESEHSSFIAHRLARLLRLPSPDDVRKDPRTVDAYRRVIADFQNDPDETRGVVFKEQEVGGVFVIGPGNTCDFDFRSEFVGEEPDMPMLLVRCKATSNSSRFFCDWFLFVCTGCSNRKLALGISICVSFLKLLGSEASHAERALH